FFLTLPRPPISTLFPTRRSSDLIEQLAHGEPPAVGTHAPPEIPGRTRAEVVRRILVYVALLGISFLFFVPFFWALSTSLKSLPEDRKSTRLNSSHSQISYAVFCL